MKIELTKKAIPRDEKGDPAFMLLRGGRYDLDEEDDTGQKGVLDVFTPGEVVYMVNKYIYFVQSQQAAHGKRAKRQREALHLVRKKVRAMFGVSWDNATREQQEAALKALGESA